MPRILVLYGTTEGHTAKIAAAIGDTLSGLGADVDIVEDGTADLHAADYAGVIVAASVHGGQYQRTVRRWVRKNLDGLTGKPTAFVSVCLAVLQWEPQVRQQVNAIVDRFLMTTGWRPTWTKSVAGALMYSKYGWLKRWIMKRIAAKSGGDTDTSRDYEYTDWRDVRWFAERFGRVVVPPAGADRDGAVTHPQAA